MISRWLEIIRGCTGLNLVGADLMGVSPSYDTIGNAVLLAANPVFEILYVLPGCLCTWSPDWLVFGPVVTIE